MSQLPPLPPNIDASKVWRLDLAEALQTALHQNLGIVLERQAVQVARLGIMVSRGEFEPSLSLSYDHGRSDAPPLTLQEGGDGAILTFITDDWNLGYAQRFETGLKLNVAFTNSRARSSAGTAVEPLNYRSQASVTVDQPLLRGFSPDLVIPRADVLKAKIASERERAQLAVTAADIVEKTEDAYWDVVAALYRYDLDLRSQKRAEEQMVLTQRQIEAGFMPPSDKIGAESTLAQRKLQTLVAESDIERAWDGLRSVMNLPRDQWSRPILPIDMPAFVPQTSSAEDALGVAIKHRPELAQLDLDLETSLISVRQAENNTLPQVDVQLSGALIGQDNHYAGALDGIGKADTHAYQLLLNFVWTPLQRAAGASAEIERKHHAMSLVRRDQLVQDVWLAVRDAVRNQTAAARQVIAAAKSRELSTETLDVEQRKFLSNQATQLAVSQRQEELANAQLAELTAVLGHKKATAALLRATGKLLDERHIQLDAK
jgi:outer membrane protein TolC